MGYAVSGVAAAVASKVGLEGAYGRQWFCSDLISRTIGSRPQISDISSQAWDLEPGRRMGKWMGQWMKWMDRGKVALAVDVIRSLEFLLSVGCAGSRLDQGVEILCKPGRQHQQLIFGRTLRLSGLSLNFLAPLI